MQSRSLDYVKDLVSWLVHLSLSLRMSGHMKRFRVCMRTVVESRCVRLALVQIGVVLRRSSWTLRPDACIHFSASGKSVLVIPRVKATVHVPSPSVDGLRKTSRATRSAWCSPFTMSCSTAIWPSLCRVVSSTPDLSCQRQGHLPQRRYQIVQLCSASKVAVMARTRMAMTTAMAARTMSLCKVTLKQHVMPIGAGD